MNQPSKLPPRMLARLMEIEGPERHALALYYIQRYRRSIHQLDPQAWLEKQTAALEAVISELEQIANESK